MKRTIVSWRNRYTGEKAYVLERHETPMNGRRGNPKKFRYVTFKCFGNIYTVQKHEFEAWYEKIAIGVIDEAA